MTGQQPRSGSQRTAGGQTAGDKKREYREKRDAGLGCGRLLILVLLGPLVWWASSCAPANEAAGEQGAGAASPSPSPTPTPPEPVPAGAQLVSVERVVDGDTIVVRADVAGDVLASARQVTAHLLAVDAPEAKRGSKSAECYGPEASGYLEDVVGGQDVWVLSDVESRDRLGQHVLYAWTEQGSFVNERLVGSGHAEAALNEPNDRYWKTIRAKERSARKAGRGLWSACKDPPPAKPDKPEEPKEPAKQEQPQQPDPKPPAPPARNCDPNYSGCVPPYPPDVDCSDIAGPVRVTGGDPHRLDRDGDGVGCET